MVNTSGWGMEFLQSVYALDESTLTIDYNDESGETAVAFSQ